MRIKKRIRKNKDRMEEEGELDSKRLEEKKYAERRTLEKIRARDIETGFGDRVCTYEAGNWLR
jgi:hypothetical protein